MSDGPHRMWGDPAALNGVYSGADHVGEHDESLTCSLNPRCIPVDEGALATVKDDRPAGYEPPPTHYSGRGGLDPWAVWDAFDLDRYTANAVKYLLRAGKKDIAPRLDDLRKAANYIAKAIEMEEGRA